MLQNITKPNPFVRLQRDTLAMCNHPAITLDVSISTPPPEYQVKMSVIAQHSGTQNMTTCGGSGWKYSQSEGCLESVQKAHEINSK